MQWDRRKFLQRSALAASVAPTALMSHHLVTQVSLQTAPTADSGNSLAERMTWLNEPASSKISGGQLTVRSRAKTDFWRKTFYGYITDNGHFFHLPASGDFVFQARVNGEYAALYDQAGLMVRLNAESWVKCGTEFFDGQRHDLSNTAPIWWRAVRKKDSIETLCSLDGKNFTSVRQGYFPPMVQVDTGIMCAAPEGPGFNATFDYLTLERA